MKRKEEILAVKELGEKIGYGNMMDIASALWSMKYSEEGDLIYTHIPTVVCNLKKEAIPEAQTQLIARVNEIKWSLSHDKEVTDVKSN